MLTRIIALDNLCTNKILRIFINKEKDKIRVKENRVIFSLAHCWFIMWMLCGNRFRLWFHIVWQLVGSVRHSCWQFLRRKFDKSIYSHCPLAVCFLWMAELVVVKKSHFIIWHVRTQISSMGTISRTLPPEIALYSSLLIFFYCWWCKIEKKFNKKNHKSISFAT